MMKQKTILHRLALTTAMLLVSIPTIAATLPGWIGTYTNNRQITGSVGIYSFQWNTETGQLTNLRPAVNTENPSFILMHPNGRYLYAVNEYIGAAGRIGAYAVDPAAPENLTALNTVPSNGIEPCHLSIDASGKWLFVANYQSGGIAIYPIQNDGRLGEAKQTIQQTGSGPANRQQSAHAHHVVLSPDNRFLLSVDLGADKVFIYRFNAATGELAPHAPASISVTAGYGPRHLVFSKDARFVYLMTELEPTIITLRWDAQQGTLTQLASISTLPQGFTGRKSGAEIVLHPNGKFLYASNRGGSNTIAIFRLGADGLPTVAGHVPSGGEAPRFFNIDPSGKFLMAAHQTSNDMFVFHIDANTGGLMRMDSRIEVPMPVSFLFGSEAGR